MNWQSVVERTVTGLGYDLVDAEKGVGGLLRVYIDHPVDHPGAPDSKAANRFITVDDCEKVTRQLQHVLEVEGCSYERLEVSSPGLDRPLKRPADYARFAGEQVEVTLKLPFDGRKKYRGELQAGGGAGGEGEGGWQLKLGDPQAPRRGKGRGRRSEVAAASEVDQVLEFSLDEVREARLVPVVDFKGPRVARDESGGAGSHPEDMVDGGRIQ